MITVHHLNNSRSQRILWILEELELDYTIKFYQRDAMTSLAPPELKAVHPLGKSPVITDDAITVAESGAIIEYLVDKYGNGRFKPAAGTPAALDYLQWMHFAEGSAMVPFLLSLYTGLLGDAAAPLKPRIVSEMHNHLDYMRDRLSTHDYFVADRFTAVDVQLCFVLEALGTRGWLESYPTLRTYVARMQARPAYLTALDKGGPYAYGPARAAG
ncbi:MAG: glutathione S-transferase family protein [Caulobacterales bacterium]|jgi:glutathione S-transferase